MRQAPLNGLGSGTAVVVVVVVEVAASFSCDLSVIVLEQVLSARGLVNSLQSSSSKSGKRKLQP